MSSRKESTFDTATFKVIFIILQWFRKRFYKLQEWLAAQGDESSVCVVSGDQVLTPILVFVYYFGF